MAGPTSFNTGSSSPLRHSDKQPLMKQKTGEPGFFIYCGCKR